jgi:hypothetical protein
MMHPTPLAVPFCEMAGTSPAMTQCLDANEAFG